jgi:predicted DNA-binding ribbon-helix-helix protein
MNTSISLNDCSWTTMRIVNASRRATLTAKVFSAMNEYTSKRNIHAQPRTKCCRSVSVVQQFGSTGSQRDRGMILRLGFT